MELTPYTDKGIGVDAGGKNVEQLREGNIDQWQTHCIPGTLGLPDATQVKTSPELPKNRRPPQTFGNFGEKPATRCRELPSVDMAVLATGPA